MTKLHIEMTTKVGRNHRFTSIPTFWLDGSNNLETTARIAREIVDPEHKSRVFMGLGNEAGEYLAITFEPEGGLT